MAKTRIFISSVNEDGLKPLRRSVFRELRELGHEPLMWEENMGPWPAHVNPVIRCLEEVAGSDLYLLFIGSRAGTYYEQAQRTVTHMEMIQACDKGKTILAFADVRVKDAFFGGGVKRRIDEFIDHTVGETGLYPAPSAIMSALSGQAGVPGDVEPYVWYLLHDIASRGIYLDDLAPGVSIDWRTYFSDLLRRGSLLLPLQSSITENGSRLEQYDEAFSMLSEMFAQLGIAGLQDAGAFLRSVSSRMPGGAVLHRYGKYMTETIGSYGACTAVTLYARRDERMHIVAQYGNATGLPRIRLNDQGSYVALTYQFGRDTVHFTESKMMFYLCLRGGEHVLTIHLPAGPEWNSHKYIHFQESVNDAILNKNPYLIEMIKRVIGGLQP